MNTLCNPLQKIIASYLDWRDDELRTGFEKNLDDENINKLYSYWKLSTRFENFEKNMNNNIGTIISSTINGTYHSIDDKPTIARRMNWFISLSWYKYGILHRYRNYPIYVYIDFKTKIISMYWDCYMNDVFVFIMLGCKDINDFRNKHLKNIIGDDYYNNSFYKYKLVFDKYIPKSIMRHS